MHKLSTIFSLPILLLSSFGVNANPVFLAIDGEPATLSDDQNVLIFPSGTFIVSDGGVDLTIEDIVFEDGAIVAIGNSFVNFVANRIVLNGSAKIVSFHDDVLSAPPVPNSTSPGMPGSPGINGENAGVLRLQVAALETNSDSAALEISLHGQNGGNGGNGADGIDRFNDEGPRGNDGLGREWECGRGGGGGSRLLPAEDAELQTCVDCSIKPTPGGAGPRGGDASNGGLGGEGGDGGFIQLIAKADIRDFISVSVRPGQGGFSGIGGTAGRGGLQGPRGEYVGSRLCINPHSSDRVRSGRGKDGEPRIKKPNEPGRAGRIVYGGN